MEYVNGKVAVAAAAPPPPPPQPLPSSVSPLHERISKLLSGWRALQMAIKNEWGGPDSMLKYHQLASDLLSWLFHSKGKINISVISSILSSIIMPC